jgi:hypothetical protein
LAGYSDDPLERSGFDGCERSTGQPLALTAIPCYVASVCVCWYGLAVTRPCGVYYPRCSVASENLLEVHARLGGVLWEEKALPFKILVIDDDIYDKIDSVSGLPALLELAGYDVPTSVDGRSA